MGLFACVDPPRDSVMHLFRARCRSSVVGGLDSGGLRGGGRGSRPPALLFTARARPSPADLHTILATPANLHFPESAFSLSRNLARAPSRGARRPPRRETDLWPAVDEASLRRPARADENTRQPPNQTWRAQEQHQLHRLANRPLGGDLRMRRSPGHG